MTREEFQARYGALFEHSPWVAARAFELAGEDLNARFRAVLEGASGAERRALICAHPELAARVALTEASAAEQEQAGLRALSVAQFEEFAGLNAAYRARFGFPFVICVREHDRESIIASLRARLGNDAAAEERTAIGEILKIARYRLELLP